ncbi:Protein of unknown function (DUF1997 [Striga hermonthica]|uniref:Uncharacterized protein n=1 Tax=Striga hermonthica TaxID=68872 RepID=A0A9N7N8Z7_STRHE|nr:Protein of unknown function (DUF1997 [Striga hermonthica]
MEKEQLLYRSLDRIKSVESDLEQTKRALNSTVTKQRKITELLENLRESKFHARARVKYDPHPCSQFHAHYPRLRKKEALSFLIMVMGLEKMKITILVSSSFIHLERKILNTSALRSYQFFDSNLYRCVLPQIKFLSIRVSPVLDLQVIPTGEDCELRCCPAKFEGSEFMERQNEKFSAFMRNHIIWESVGAEQYLDVDVKLNLILEIYTLPFALMPISAVEGPENKRYFFMGICLSNEIKAESTFQTDTAAGFRQPEAPVEQQQQQQFWGACCGGPHRRPGRSLGCRRGSNTSGSPCRSGGADKCCSCCSSKTWYLMSCTGCSPDGVVEGNGDGCLSRGAASEAAEELDSSGSP